MHSKKDGLDRWNTQLYQLFVYLSLHRFCSFVGEFTIKQYLTKKIWEKQFEVKLTRNLEKLGNFEKKIPLKTQGEFFCKIQEIVCLFKYIMNPYNCLLKNANFSIKTSNE